MDLFTKKHKAETGFSLVEVMVAVSLLLVIIVGNISSNSITTKTITLNQKRQEANRLAREGMEALYSVRANNFLDINLGNFHPILGSDGWSMANGSEQIGDFTRVITLTRVQRELTCEEKVCDIVTAGGITDEGSFFANVSVSWIESGQTKKIDLSSLITYWR